MEKGARKQEIQKKNVMRRLLSKNFLPVQRIQLAASAKEAGRADGRGRDEAAAKIRSRGRMDAENRCWVSELLAAADCEKSLDSHRM